MASAQDLSSLVVLLCHWDGVIKRPVRAPDRTNTQGLKITEENMLPLQ